MRVNSIQNYNYFKGQPMVVGNMKMNKTPNETLKLFSDIEAQLWDAPVPLPYIGMAPTALSFLYANNPSFRSFHKGAQEADIGTVKGGAMTGAISQDMYKNLGAEFVIIGHSERRVNFDETDEKVNLKLLSALKKGLRPIVCVGESLLQRESRCTDRVISDQIAKAISNVNKKDISKVVIAYEPLWAINTGKSCDPEEANRVCGSIRRTVARLYGDKAAEDITILYGGSVKPNNAEELFNKNNIDGGLIGGACLSADDFVPIVQALCRTRKSDIEKYGDK